MEKKNKENIKIFRNVYCIVIGVGFLIFWNYTFYFNILNTFSGILCFLFLCLYMPIYHGLILLIFKHEMGNMDDEGLVPGEAIALGGASITLVCMLLSFFAKYILPKIF